MKKTEITFSPTEYIVLFRPFDLSAQRMSTKIAYTPRAEGFYRLLCEKVLSPDITYFKFPAPPIPTKYLLSTYLVDQLKML